MFIRFNSIKVNLLYFSHFLLLSLFLLSPTKIFAQDEVEVSWSRVNIRSGPGPNYSVVGSVFRGERYPVLGKSNNWINIELKDDTKGWVRSDTVKVIKAQPSPEPETQVEIQKEQPKEIQPEKTIKIEADSSMDKDQETQIAVLSKKIDQLEEKIAKMLEVQPSLIEKMMANKTWSEKIHGGFEIGWFSPTDILRNSFGTGISFNLIGSYELTTHVHPQLGFGYFMKKVSVQGGG